MLLAALIGAPLLAGLLAWRSKRLRGTETISVIGAGLTMVLAAVVVVQVIRDGSQQGLGGILYVDAFSALIIAMIAGLGCAATLVSIGYLRRDLAARHVPDGPRGVRLYYLGIHIFVASMLATASFNNLGLLWVGVEATTLASALLVGFYRTESALEAAWKYLIICTVGITFALFGVILSYYAALQAGLEGASSLDWTVLSARAADLDPSMMRLAFVFVLVGFGTKAGFAPLHTWLADAHSQAPSPVSALLSGVLLTCALYAIVRFHVITIGATGSNFSGYLLIVFGVISVAVAVPFILVQRDLKRLLAYSSVEHIGLMALAFGIGGRLGLYAGLLHMINHAVTKALLFFVAGDIVQRFGIRRISAIRGAARLAPVLGWLLLASIFAISGSPPFGVFTSELSIVMAGFQDDRVALAGVIATVILLGAAFAGLLVHALRMVYGKPPRRLISESPPSSLTRGRPEATALVAIVPLAAVALLFGVHVPAEVNQLIDQITSVLQPVSGVAAR